MKSLGEHNTHDLLFTDIFKRYESRMYSLALYITKSDQVAKDILQDVFLKLWEHRLHLDNINNLEAWLYKATENRVIDFLRKASADKRLRDKLWVNLKPAHNDTEEAFYVREYNRVLAKAIAALPAQRKKIYQLCKEDGWDYKQVADELQISKNTVKNQLFSAIQSIRHFLVRSSKCMLPFL